MKSVDSQLLEARDARQAWNVTSKYVIMLILRRFHENQTAKRQGWCCIHLGEIMHIARLAERPSTVGHVTIQSQSTTTAIHLSLVPTSKATFVPGCTGSYHFLRFKNDLVTLGAFMEAIGIALVSVRRALGEGSSPCHSDMRAW